MKTNTTDKTVTLAMTGLLTALITVSIMVLPIPIPMTTGYVNLGDGMIFLAVMLVGTKYGAMAGGLGAALADILLGSAAWAPWTLAIKAGMALITGAGLRMGRGNAGMAAATVFMAAGYYAAEGIMYGNWAAPLLGLPWNLVQGTVGTVAAVALSTALKKTSARKYFK